MFMLIGYDKEKETPWVHTLALLTDFALIIRILEVQLIQHDTR